MGCFKLQVFFNYQLDGGPVYIYEACSETIETITILSNLLSSILNKLHIHQEQHPRGRGLRNLTNIFNSFGAIAFR